MQIERRKAVKSIALAYLAGLTYGVSGVCMTSGRPGLAAGLMLAGVFWMWLAILQVLFTLGRPRGSAAVPPAGFERIRGGYVRPGPPSSPRPSGSLAQGGVSERNQPEIRLVLLRVNVPSPNGETFPRDALEDMARRFNARPIDSYGVLAVEGNDLVWYGPASMASTFGGVFEGSGAVGMSSRGAK